MLRSLLNGAARTLDLGRRAARSRRDRNSVDAFFKRLIAQLPVQEENSRRYRRRDRDDVDA
jgi:hypothetical protein